MGLDNLYWLCYASSNLFFGTQTLEDSMAELHAEIHVVNTLVNTTVDTDQKQDEQHPAGLRYIGAISGGVKQHLVFSAVWKDVLAVIPPTMWETLDIEQTADQTIVSLPVDSVEDRLGSWLALDIRIPELEPGEKRVLRITQVEVRPAVPGVAGNYEIWRKRWLDSFGHNPPPGIGLIYEMHTEEAVAQN